MTAKEPILDLRSVNCPVCASTLLPTNHTRRDGIYAANCVNCGHFFKFRSNNLNQAANSITFKVNGKDCTVGNEYAASTTLLEYLRQERLSMGTKGMCREGGCGVCLVTVNLMEPVTQKKLAFQVNSCLLPLYSCDGYEVTTIEALGNPRDGLHPIQEKLAIKDGAQCGFCSPGQVMNMFGLLKQNSKPTMQDIEDAFDATICRCTGYRPILDAMKSFAVDVPPELKGAPIDIEDLDLKICKKIGKPCNGRCSSSSNEGLCSKNLHIVTEGAQWFKPATLVDLTKLLKQYKTQNYRLVFGNSGSGVFKELALKNYDIIIDIRGIQEFYGIDFDPIIVLGSNLSINTFRDLMNKTRTDESIVYAGVFADHLKYVAMQGIRNLGCWAGNLMMKHKHNEFQSDIFTLLETVGTKLRIADEEGNQAEYTLPSFLSLSMKGKVITAMLLPTFDNKYIKVRTYRAALRLQACHSYVVTGIRMEVDGSDNYLVKSKPSIVMAGISATFIHAEQTENYLVNKKLGDPEVLKQALSTLAQELVPTTGEGQSSAAYRKNLGLAMFYKFCLDICQKVADPRYVSGGQPMVRPLMTGKQDYGDTTKSEWPLTEPIPKTIAQYLTSGTVQYLDDQPTPDALCAAVVVSSIGNAKIKSIDASAALAYPGVKAFIKASDIPKGGINNSLPQGLMTGAKQELLCSGTVYYAGQAIGIVVADLESTARYAVSMVKVEYMDQQPVVTDLRDAVAKKRFFPNLPPPTTVGDPTGAIKSAPHVITGSIYCGDQYHLHMETQAATCTPTDTGGMTVKATTQWIDGVLETVAQVLGMKQSDVTVEIERLGGAYGGKITQNFPVSGLCALASYVLEKKVKLNLDLHTNMKMLGKRKPYLADYEVGVDDTGKLLGISITLYEDCGAFGHETSSASMLRLADNAYYCANWLWTPMPVRTDKPVNTACRAPASVPVMFVIETIMDHIASELKLEPSIVRKTNLYVKGQSTPGGDVLTYCTIRNVVAQLENQVHWISRKAAVELFNKSNRWKKRGIAMMPNKFGIEWTGAMYNTTVTIFHGDGSVAISHGGIDMGQGINTKVIQVCAYELGIPIDLIRVKNASSIINANSITSGGSITTELCAKGVIECCKTLNDRMAPVKQKMKKPDWDSLISKCNAMGIDLTASYMTNPKSPHADQYSCYSAAVVEAEIDVLTGQYQLRQLDMLYDCGESMNPELDMGQAEGAFLMGVGYFLLEEMKYDSKTGEAINATTWEYKPPLTKDLPLVFNITFQRNVPNPLGVLRAKAVGEPPVTMSVAALLAVKHAIEAARAEIGQSGYFALNAPATVDKIQTLCMNDQKNFVFKPPAKLNFSYEAAQSRRFVR